MLLTGKLGLDTYDGTGQFQNFGNWQFPFFKDLYGLNYANPTVIEFMTVHSFRKKYGYKRLGAVFKDHYIINLSKMRPKSVPKIPFLDTKM